MEGPSSGTLFTASSSGSTANYAMLSLDDWINKFGRIYGKRHEKHTTEYMISRLVEEVAELVNPMESQDIERIAPNLADVFSWICSIAFKLNLDLSNLAWKKYGENAPRPSWSSNTQPALSDFSQPANLKQWQEFISTLYKTENTRLSPMNALVAMMKDVGDTAMLQRKRATSDQIASKMASILAWTLTIAQLLKLDLGKVVFSKYDDHCPVCGKPVCDTDICHPLATMYVSFGEATSDEEKYIVLDTCASFGFKCLVDSLSQANATRDLSTSLDLISNSDAACILLSQSASESALYTQIFETLTCFSSLSKGDVFIFAKDPSKGIASFISRTFSSENIVVNQYSDTNNLKATIFLKLEELKSKRKSLTKKD